MGDYLCSLLTRINQTFFSLALPAVEYPVRIYQVFCVLGVVRITQMGFFLKVALPFAKYVLFPLLLCQPRWPSVAWTWCDGWADTHTLHPLEHACLCSQICLIRTPGVLPRDTIYIIGSCRLNFCENDADLLARDLAWDSTCITLAKPKGTVRRVLIWRI